MSSYLKGNFETKRKVAVERPSDANIEQEFEQAALKRLGGSIAFVAKRKIAWSLEEENASASRKSKKQAN